MGAAAFDQLGEAARPSERKTPRSGSRAPGATIRRPSCRCRARHPPSRCSRRRRGSSLPGGPPRHDKDEAGVVGHVEPLVGVGRPRIGQLDAPKRCASRVRGGPEPERAVDVEPAAARARRLATSAADRRRRCSRCRPGRTRSSGPTTPARIDRERVGAHPALAIGRDPGRRPRPSPSIWSEAWIVTWDSVADDQRIGGAPSEPVVLDVPAGTLEERVAGGRERREVGHRRAGREADAVPAGRPNRSNSQPPAISSTTAAAGDITYRPAFWSQALASQSAPSAAGWLPPMTKPK